jgi:hypothetical protein
MDHCVSSVQQRIQSAAIKTISTPPYGSHWGVNAGLRQQRLGFGNLLKPLILCEGMTTHGAMIKSNMCSWHRL